MPVESLTITERDQNMRYGVAMISRLLKNIGLKRLFCKRDLYFEGAY